MPFQDRYLWDDPITIPAPVAGGSVLLANQIRSYIQNYGLLIEAGFEERHLKPASYTLTPTQDATETWMFTECGDPCHLKKIKEGRRFYYLVPSNSLVYVTVREKFRMPYYLIGRFNLKVRYAYQGLLLGTGPQVDPGFNTHLIIPLHNLTTRNFKLYLNESFISIDFVRTTALDAWHDAPNEQRFRHINPHIKLFPEVKNSRSSVYNYLDGFRPCSSLGDLAPAITKAVKERKRWDYAFTITALAAILALLGLIYQQYNTFTPFYLDVNSRLKGLEIASDATSRPKVTLDHPNASLLNGSDMPLVEKFDFTIRGIEPVDVNKAGMQKNHPGMKDHPQIPGSDSSTEPEPKL